MKSSTASLLRGWSLVVVCSLLAMVAAVWNANHGARTRALERLRTSTEITRDLQAQELDMLELRAQTLAGDAAFVDYVSQSLVPNPQLGGAIDSLSISDLLKQRRHGDDMVMLLDATGTPVTAIGSLGKDRASIPRDPLVVASITQLAPVKGVWLDQGDLLWVVVSPLLRGRTPQGYLITASHASQTFFAKIGRLSRSDVALLTDPAPQAAVSYSTGLDAGLTDLMVARRKDILATQGEQGTGMHLQDGHSSADIWITPLALDSGHAALIALDQRAGADRGMDEETLYLLLGIGLLGVLAALYVWLQWCLTWRPLSRLSDAFDSDRNAIKEIQGSALVRDVRDRLLLLLKSIR
jgi:hypothetical protein